MKTKKSYIGLAVMSLAIAECTLIILSWLISATRIDGVRSLLSSEGIRWLFGSFIDITSSPLLVWLILILMALGSFQKSGITHLRSMSYRDRLALRVSLSFLLIYLVIIGLLTLMPHAILLSVTGSLFPSAFSRSLVLIVSFGICLFSITFSMMSGRSNSVADVMNILTFGIQKGASILILYFIFVQFIESLYFVFG